MSQPDPWQAWINNQGNIPLTHTSGFPNVFPSPPPPNFTIFYAQHTGHPERPEKHPFSDKVAMAREHQYDGVHSGTTWRLSTRNYLVPRAYDMDILLKICRS